MSWNTVDDAVLAEGSRVLDRCRRRIQQDTHGHRGRAGDPLYCARRTLHTGSDLLTDRQTQRLTALFAVDEHVQVEATWGVYQRMIGAYREPDRARGRQLMTAVIASLSQGVPAALTELVTLGRTLTERAGDILAYVDRPRHLQWPDRSAEGPPRAPARFGPGVPQPGQ